jgi:hypothetical protein
MVTLCIGMQLSCFESRIWFCMYAENYSATASLLRMLNTRERQQQHEPAFFFFLCFVA